MPPSPTDTWTDRARETLDRYAEPLRRGVVTRLVKARMPPPTEELADRLFSTLSNPPVVDRRLRELPEAARKLLAFIGISRRPDWKVGHLITLLAAIGHAEGFGPILHLLQTGLLFPHGEPGSPEISDFEAWLGSAGTLHATVFALPVVAARARGEPLGLPDLSQPEPEDDFAPPAAPRSTDGLDWLLRVAVVWQQVLAAPMRLTQANTLFKRDLGRLQADDVLTAPAADQLIALPDLGVLALFWARSSGLLQLKEGELTAGSFPATWGATPTATLTEMWAGLTAIESWDPLLGYAPSDETLSATPSAGFLALLLIGSIPDDGWIPAPAIADWLWEHHPSWSGSIPREAATERGRIWVEAYILGVAYPLRLVEVQSHPEAAPRFRLTDLGRHLLTGYPEPSASPTFPQTLLVQPNAEILAYRQGLTPDLVARLSRFARWKTLGPACTLDLTAENTYHGLESGLTLAGIVQTLNQHGMRPVPPAVADLLQRWANKRERITIFGSATLVEFQTAADLDAAVARGIVSIRVTDRLGLTGDGQEPDFKQLRLIGNRDYEAKPQQCVSVCDDGLTLTIDTALSDLLFEAEIVRLADPVPGDPPGIRRFRITHETLNRAITGGMTLDELDSWFQNRAGCSLSPAARLFVLGRTAEPLESAHKLVIAVPSEELGDGLFQWTATRQLIAQRLGPTAFAIEPEQLAPLQATLAGIGMTLQQHES